MAGTKPGHDELGDLATHSLSCLRKSGLPDLR